MKKAILLFLLAVCPCTAWPALAGQARVGDARSTAVGSKSAAASRVVEAADVREATALKIDGELTDEVWSRAPKIDAFVQRDPKEGAPASFETEARVAYDAQHLYVAILAHDPDPSKITGFLTRRDTNSPSDW